MTNILLGRSGVRGESFGDTARRLGEIAGVTVPSDATDEEVLELLAGAAGTAAVPLAPVHTFGDPASGLLAPLIATDTSSMLRLLGDSTGVNTAYWFYRFVYEKLKPAYPSHRIVYRLWDDTTARYGAESVLQAGSAARSLRFTGTSFRSLQLAECVTRTNSEDIEVEVKFSMDDWTPSSQVRLIGQLGAAPDRSWYINIRTNGFIDFIWSADGTTLLTATSTSAIGFTDGAIGWLRIKFDGNNGAAGNTCTFEKSTDGSNWTNFGTHTQAGTTTVKTNSTATYQVGAVQGTGPLIGNVYETTIRDGINGPIINPLTVEAWQPDSDDATLNRSQEIVGTPTLYVYNGSQSGATLDYLCGTDAASGAAARPAKMQVFAPVMTTFLSCGHNDAAYRPGLSLSAKWALFNTALRTRAPHSTYVMFTQNPRYTGIDGGKPFSAMQRERARALIGVAQAHNYELVDTYTAYHRAVAAGSTLAALIADGVHPTAGAGVDVWVNEAWRAFTQRSLG